MRIALAIALVLAGGACNKKQAPPAATGGSGPIASSAEYRAKALGIMDGMIAVFANADGDCDKLAAAVTKFVDDTKPTFDAAEAWEKTHPEDKAETDRASEAKIKKFEEVATPVMTRCKDNKALDEAMKKMPGADE